MTTATESLDYEALSKVLAPSKRDELEKAIASALFSVLGKDGAESARNKMLENENKRLRENKDISDAVSDVAENAIFEARRSRNKIINLWKRVKNFEKEERNSAYKLRMALWTTAKSIWLSNEERKKLKKFNKFNIDDWYRIVAKWLKSKMDSSKDDKEKVAIRSIMKQLNKYHEIYTSEHHVTSLERSSNMRDIDRSMSKAA